MSHHSLVLIKVQLTFGTAKLGYQVSGTTNLTKDRIVSLPLKEGLNACEGCEGRGEESRPRVHLHGTSKGLKRKT